MTKIYCPAISDYCDDANSMTDEADKLRLEVAEYHDRTYHLIKYNPEYPAVHYRIMHELTHLLFATQARQA